MTRFDVKILGCGSAMPTTLHNPSSQLVNVNEKLFMVDCGEGTQLQMRKFKTRMSKLHSIFISHLHGDHILGLPGLISTLNILGRKRDLNIYAHKEIEPLLTAALNYFCTHLEFQIHFYPVSKIHTTMERKTSILPKLYYKTISIPSYAKRVSGKTACASRRRASNSVYRDEKWPRISFFTPASLAICAACRAVE
jgi:ribonuclease BN (tRNA processing enzyme)